MCYFRLQTFYLDAAAFDTLWTLVSVCPKTAVVKQKICPLSGIQTPFPGLPGPRLVTVLTEIIRLKINPVYGNKTKNYG
jgi:hypothetical protein